ncbi:3-methyl-2-oxobutanoate hydroxymethyltransferase [Chitinophaga sp. Cy-1792]|uniref:3-methyl-2-oxobutanoate hydroxymethyltransferase n=1 Tax=Chitinophaga sp. Cy-1792 TaxID=2608339 RepID=UPI0014241F05|nr:3-methyl-2-oxobutanoate hydroxymethyltransferase [Chitinophaga sp. Cy-1792]NIG55879.1 3-methyl-2-oxobutanoate hydroxymethyltransferase [Chitinophaga sp. Cy-1792]
MSQHKDIKRTNIQTLQAMKVKGEKIAMLTTYDYTMATILDQAGVDILLVGDSAANVMAGYESTLPITLEHMIYHAQCVVRGAKQAFILVDLPFGTYQGNPRDALSAAIRVMKESGAQGIKVEGGAEIIDSVKAILSAGIPVMGHLGLTPQSINQLGGYGLQGKSEAEANKLLEDATLLQEAGCFSVLLEKIPAALGKKISESLHIPTISIGAGKYCDGQVLVVQDMMGMNKGFKPKFLREYANLFEVMTGAVQQYISDVKDNSYPASHEQY